MLASSSSSTALRVLRGHSSLVRSFGHVASRRGVLLAEATEGTAPAGSAGDNGSSSSSNDVVAQLQAKVKDLEDKYVRSLAEMENVRTRSRRDVDNAKLFGIQGFAKDLLSVADVLRLALEHMPKEAKDATAGDSNEPIKQLVVGVEMTERELLKVFDKHGLKQVDPANQPFDPNLHNAIFELDDPAKEPGTVAFVQKKGYTLNDRPLRPADVGVVRRK